MGDVQRIESPKKKINSGGLLVDHAGEECQAAALSTIRGVKPRPMKRSNEGSLFELHVNTKEQHAEYWRRAPPPRGWVGGGVHEIIS